MDITLIEELKNSEMGLSKTIGKPDQQCTV